MAVFENEPMNAPTPTVAPSAVRPFGFWGTMVLGVSVFVAAYLVSGIVIAGVYALAHLLKLPTPERWIAGFSVEMIFLPALATLVLLGLAAAVRHRGGLRAYCALRLPRRREWGLCALAFFPPVLAAGLLLEWCGVETITLWQRKIFSGCGTPGLSLLFVLFVFIAPLWEEILFRGFFYTGLAGSFVRRLGAVALPSALWALMHLQYEPALILTIFFYGLLLGYIRMRSGSLWVCIAFHAANNLISYIETYYVVYMAT